MQPEQYEAWYATQRGAWIGNEEYRLIASLLAQPLLRRWLPECGAFIAIAADVLPDHRL